MKRCPAEIRARWHSLGALYLTVVGSGIFVAAADHEDHGRTACQGK